MKIVRSKLEFQQTRSRLQGVVGLVPTMGALHEGHLSLIRQAKQESDQVVVTIFINPLQFGEGEDYETYPRTPEVDLEKAQSAGADVVWLPEVHDLYEQKQIMMIDVGELGEELCGKNRPGHFNGMATVVMKFLQIIRPDRAYFGQKDAQQLAIIKQMATDFLINTTIVGGPTVRDHDGLALSSRNQYLTEQERKDAPELYQTLRKAVAELKENKSRKDVLKRVTDALSIWKQAWSTLN